MIMRDGEFATMMQHQEEEEAQKSMEKEQQAMTSTPTGKALLIVHSVLSLQYLLQSYIPQNLGIASKVTTLAMDSMFFNSLLRLQAIFRVSGENATVDIGYNLKKSSLLGMICTNRLMNPTKRITKRTTANFSAIPTYDLWSLGSILYHRLFGSPLCSLYCQQTNGLFLFYIPLLSFLCKFYVFNLIFLIHPLKS